MFKKLSHIVIGWSKRFGILQVSQAEAKLSKLRLEKCKGCMHAKKSSLLKIINGVENYSDSLVCMRCSCPCLEKSLVVDESCPIDKW